MRALKYFALFAVWAVIAGLACGLEIAIAFAVGGVTAVLMLLIWPNTPYDTN